MFQDILGGLYYEKISKRVISLGLAATMTLTMSSATFGHDLATFDDSPTTFNENPAAPNYDWDSIDILDSEMLLSETRVPMASIYGTFPDGSYYTKNGQACTCHSWCDWNVSYNTITKEYCNCRIYDNSIQCVAFAKYIFYNARGYKWSEGETIYKNVTNITAETAKSALRFTYFGSYVLVISNNGNEHSFAVLDTTDTGIKIYDANSQRPRGNGKNYEPCQVRMKTLTWQEFANQYRTIIKVVQ